jgi:putative RecB family exonuclease
MCVPGLRLRIIFAEPIYLTEQLAGIQSFTIFSDKLAYEESHDGCVTLVDLKTASKRLSQSNVDTNLQLTAYALATESMGFNSDELTFRLDVLLKTKDAEMVRYETSPRC